MATDLYITFEEQRLSSTPEATLEVREANGDMINLFSPAIICVKQKGRRLDERIQDTEAPRRGNLSHHP